MATITYFLPTATESNLGGFVHLPGLFLFLFFVLVPFAFVVAGGILSIAATILERQEEKYCSYYVHIFTCLV